MSGTGTVGDLPLVHTWRVATAARVFAPAIVVGQVGAAESLSDSWPTLLALAALAVVACMVELPPRTPRKTVPLLEAVAAVSLVALGPGPVGAVAPCLAVPVLVAGVRLGGRAVITVFCVSLLIWVGVAALDLVGALPAGAGLRVAAAATWLFAGAGAGLVAAVQTRSARLAAAEQAPYAAAHRLVAQLHSLVSRRRLDLDAGSLAQSVLDAAASAGARRCSVWARGEGGVEQLAATHRVGWDEHALVTARLDGRPAAESRALQLLPLRVGEQVFGVVVADFGRGYGRASEDLQTQVDELAVRLDTALLVDRIQSVATSEERRRLARDLHDGAAQRLVALGLSLDEVAEAAAAGDADTAELVEGVRVEVTGIVQDLRSSVFDLRQDLEEAGGLSGALTECTRELSRNSHLRVHLSLDERGPRLPRRTECELVSIAREAIGNAHRHAEAVNLWVSLATDGELVHLRIEDDGVGAVLPKPGHYGLHTMRERAEQIDALLEVGPRRDGGTVVQVRPRRCSGDTASRLASFDSPTLQMTDRRPPA